MLGADGVSAIKALVGNKEIGMAGRSWLTKTVVIFIVAAGAARAEDAASKPASAAKPILGVD